MANKLEITLTRSLIGRPEDQRATVNALRFTQNASNS